MRPITRNDIIAEYQAIKTVDEFLAFISKYSHRVHAAVHVMIDGHEFRPAPWVYWQDGELFIESGE